MCFHRCALTCVLPCLCSYIYGVICMGMLQGSLHKAITPCPNLPPPFCFCDQVVQLEIDRLAYSKQAKSCFHLTRRPQMGVVVGTIKHTSDQFKICAPSRVMVEGRMSRLRSAQGGSLTGSSLLQSCTNEDDGCVLVISIWDAGSRYLLGCGFRSYIPL